jgi:pimeloyl-ACP methyl ester carboxylesterase
MIEEPRGAIDYAEQGSGPTLVLVPGSCSTGAAWRPVIAEWGGGFRTVTTSLLGYGRTAERRTADDTAIAHEAECLEAVVRRAGSEAHLVGHSFGGLVAAAVAVRGQVPLASLTIIEAPAAELLREAGETAHYAAFREMTDGYFAAVGRGEAEAIAAVMDFYGGAGTFASWPAKARAYVVDTTPVNLVDWASAYGWPLSPAMLRAVDVPTLVICGGDSHPAVQRANMLISEHIPAASHATIPGATHFMMASHAPEVARIIAGYIAQAVKRGAPPIAAVPASG